MLSEDVDRNEDHLNWLKTEAAANEEDKDLQTADCETALTQVAAILPQLTASAPAPASLTPDQLADRFYLTDLGRTEAYAHIQATLQARYQPDADGDWPDGYWDELQQALDQLLRQAIALNAPFKAAAWVRRFGRLPTRETRCCKNASGGCDRSPTAAGAGTERVRRGFVSIDFDVRKVWAWTRSS